jgi:hypothetical protein
MKAGKWPISQGGFALKTSKAFMDMFGKAQHRRQSTRALVNGQGKLLDNFAAIGASFSTAAFCTFHDRTI